MPERSVRANLFLGRGSPLSRVRHTEERAQARELFARLGVDLDPDAPESLQRIFGLGLIALTLQITNKAKAQQQDDLVTELGELAREMIEAEDSPDSPG